MAADTAICTWFVADDRQNATFFPQVGARSDAPAVQAVYWRCTVDFYASSIAVNPDAKHIFITNTVLPRIDGVEIGKLFEDWGVEVVTLPITYRLRASTVGSFGNQFYIFDVIDYFAANPPAARAIVLDSDCVWMKPVAEMAAAIDEHGALTYQMGLIEYGETQPINGLTRQQMARFMAAHGGPAVDATPYYGGEIYAARQDVTELISARARALWPIVVQEPEDAPREEAHFLSILYAMEGIAGGTANRFIRRMWTTFQHHNLEASDADLSVWHLPAEKKTGFADLFAGIAAVPGCHPARDAVKLGLTAANYRRLMGWPRRGPTKLVRDLSLKIMEKVRK